MTCSARRVRGGWIAAPLAGALVVLSVGCAADDPAPKAVREAAEEHVRASGGEMSFDDPSGDGQLTLAFAPLARRSHSKADGLFTE